MKYDFGRVESKLITQIEALNYRCLRYIHLPVGPFHVLVGPNASGKTTFLDVIAFLGRLVSDGLEEALNERTQFFKDLVWMRSGDKFELAVEAEVPVERRPVYGGKTFDTIRYEVSIGLNQKSQEIAILNERVILKVFSLPHLTKQRSLFPELSIPPSTLISGKKADVKIISKVPGGNDNFNSEIPSESGKPWVYKFKFGENRSALGNLPEDDSKFPASTWFKGLLTEGVQQFVLNSREMRRASSPARGRGFKSDGSNLPWVIDRLQKTAPDRFEDWMAHVQTALPDLKHIRTVEREDDRSRYIMLCYDGGLEIPSWMASDGTLRLLALTIPAYLPDFSGVYLIEEPENGIHPRAVETVIRSLSSVYDAQILLATHSPIILSIVDADKVLCFAKSPDGATDIVLGSDHPALRDWRGEVNLGDLFAGGVLG